MTNKPIIDIDIRDEKFKAFLESWDKYKASLASMPEAWRSVGSVADGVFAGMAAALTEHAILAEKATAATKVTSTASKNTEMAWKNISGYARKFAGSILGATSTLIKWASLTGVVTGLLGGGGLYGLDRMAESVSARRRSALGLGTTYGEQSAFGINFGQTVDAGGFLSAVNQGLHSLSDRQGFMGANMSGADMQGDTAQVGVTLLTHLKKIADNTNPAMMSDIMRARGVDQFISLEEMMRLRAMTQPEFEQYKKGFTQDSSNLNLSREVQHRWASFTRQMERAGLSIENVFVKGLARIEPGLEHLSASVVHLFEKIGSSGLADRVIDKLSVGIDSLATYLGSKNFEDDLKKVEATASKVATGLGALGEKLWWLLGKLGWLPSGADASSTNQTQPDTGFHPLRDDPLMKHLGWFQDEDSKTKSGDQRIPSPSHPGAAQRQEILKNWGQRFDKIETASGIPTGLLRATYLTESSGGRDLLSKAGAEGPFQFLPRTAREYGVKDTNDTEDSAGGAARYFSELLHENRGDLMLAMASYNWGPGRVRRAQITKGDDWGTQMPAETRNYLARMLGQLPASTVLTGSANPMGAGITKGEVTGAIDALIKAMVAQPQTRVDVRNTSGGNVTIQSSQLAGAV